MLAGGKLGSYTYSVVGGLWQGVSDASPELAHDLSIPGQVGYNDPSTRGRVRSLHELLEPSLEKISLPLSY